MVIKPENGEGSDEEDEPDSHNASGEIDVLNVSNVGAVEAGNLPLLAQVADLVSGVGSNVNFAARLQAVTSNYPVAPGFPGTPHLPKPGSLIVSVPHTPPAGPRLREAKLLLIGKNQ